MAAAKKTPAKKTAAKKSAPVELDPQEIETRELDQLARFNSFRERAKGIENTKRIDLEPYTLGKEQGFAREMSAVFPKSLSGQNKLRKALKSLDAGDSGAVLDVLEILFGADDFTFILATFDREPDSAQLVTGLLYSVLEHYRDVANPEQLGKR